MPRSFKVALPETLQGRSAKDPRVLARLILGALLLLNLIAAWAVFNPVGGSAEELEERSTTLRAQLQARESTLRRTSALVAKMEQARTTGDQFMTQYFMDRRTTYSTILAELDRAAKEAGMRTRERSFAYDPIEGTDVISMMTVNANYEGTYGDLLQFVNRLDKSQRFLILDTLSAAPQQGGGALMVSVKLNAFVREGAPAPMAAAL